MTYVSKGIIKIRTGLNNKILKFITMYTTSIHEEKDKEEKGKKECRWRGTGGKKKKIKGDRKRKTEEMREEGGKYRGVPP